MPKVELIDPKVKKLIDGIICVGCDNNKEPGLTVCWNCFKYRTDVIPLKEFWGNVWEWLEYVHGVEADKVSFAEFTSKQNI